jgi:hypothetical protein
VPCGTALSVSIPGLCARVRASPRHTCAGSEYLEKILELNGVCDPELGLASVEAGRAKRDIELAPRTGRTGVLIWPTPSGRTYATTPSQYSI